MGEVPQELGTSGVCVCWVLKEGVVISESWGLGVQHGDGILVGEGGHVREQ